MDKKKFSVEDVKKKATGFWGYIKHLVKDPVKTVPEAKARWKEVLTFALISFGVTSKFMYSSPSFTFTSCAITGDERANNITKIKIKLKIFFIIKFLFS